MALFGNNKKEKETNDGSKETSSEDFSWVIKKPHITEKAALISSVNAYTFEIAPAANKVQVKKAIEAQYKVKPVKVNIVRQAARKETRRGRQVHRTGVKKAIVFLKKGDSIEFV